MWCWMSRSGGRPLGSSSGNKSPNSLVRAENAEGIIAVGVVVMSVATNAYICPHVRISSSNFDLDTIIKPFFESSRWLLLANAWSASGEGSNMIFRPWNIKEFVLSFPL